MKVSNTGINLIASFEGLKLEAYQDPVGIWTIGYGTTVYTNGKKVKKGDKFTKDEALDYLRLQAQQHADTIEKYVRVKLSQEQYDALASFQYNLGKYILSKDKVLADYLNSRNWEKATERMKEYTKAGGKVLPGLVRRRQTETTLFLKGSGVRKLQIPFDIKVDGLWGPMTTKALQRFLGLAENGIISGQLSNTITNAIDGIEIGKGGSNTIRNLQKLVGVNADGYLGKETVKSLQKYLGTPVDGEISKPSTMVKALQKFLNTSLS